MKTIFFSLVESLTLMKMDRLIITQRIKIMKTYYKNDDSATATYCALREDYGLQNRPTTQTIVKKFKGTKMVTNIPLKISLL